MSSDPTYLSMLDRRQFIALALTGTAAFTGGALITRLGGTTQPVAQRMNCTDLAMTEALVQMVDGSRVYHWAFEDLSRPRGAPQMPGPLIQAVEGDEVEINVTNHLPGTHGFRIPGVPGVAGEGVEIASGATATLTFAAPAGGSYLYFDHLNAPVNRVLGLRGPMIVLPARGTTPYSTPTPAVQRLFNDLGTTDHYPGEPWRSDRTRVWLHNSIDPSFNMRAQRGESIDAEQFTKNFLPRYFTINGLSGAYSAHDNSVIPSGRVGQPHVIRLMNVGMCWQSPHLHGNHFQVIARVGDDLDSQRVQDNVVSIDTVTLRPLERMDWLHPFIRPADIAASPSIPIREAAQEELGMIVGDVPLSPLSWPMHCHMEMSQTAAGGNYPQGAVAMWELTGDLDGVDFPDSTHAIEPASSALDATASQDRTQTPASEATASHDQTATPTEETTASRTETTPAEGD